MKALSAGTLILLLGLAAPVLEARDDRPGRGADYGDKSGFRDGPARVESEGRWRGERAAPSPSVGDAGGRSGHPDHGRDYSERERNTRIAGFQGGYRESQNQGSHRGQHDDWRSDWRGREQRHSDSSWRHDDRGDKGWRHDDHRRDQRWDSRHAQNRHRHDDWRHPQWRRDWNHGWSGHRYRAPVRYVYPRGYHARSWRIGYHLPPVFIVNHWYVDWRAYRLAPPPWGCRWLRVDGDLLLVDERSGEIVDALYGFFYY